MKKLSLIILGLFFFNANADEKVLTIASDPWCPFSCEKGAENEGLAIDLVRAAFEPLGYKIEYKVVTFLRSLEELKQGNVDMVCAVDDTLDQSYFIRGKESFSPSNFSYFTHTGTQFKYNEKNEDSFKGYLIGVNGGDSLKGLLLDSIGSYIDKNLDDKTKIQKVYGENVHTQLIQLLNSGRVDLYIDTAQVAQYYIKKSGLEDKILMGPPITKAIDEYIGFSPAKANAKELMDLFDKRMVEMKKDGTYLNILAKYGLKNN